MKQHVSECNPRGTTRLALIGGRAVVVGAGIAGMAAAASLADYFEQVIVLEQDALSNA